MAIAETARLIASLELKDFFSKSIVGAEKNLNSFDKSLANTQSRSYKAGQQIGTGIKRSLAIGVAAIGALGTQGALGVASLERLETVTAQTNAVLKSTKGAAGESAQAIRDLANKYEGLNATIDDTVIQSGANLLLTFTNIRKQAFEPALQAALNMNQALGGGEAGLQGTIQRLGRALNDPIKGLAQLTRVGVTFTKSQKDQIAAAVKAGDTFKAQGIILGELDKKFGGSFLAGGQTTAGKVAKFKDAIDDLQRALATALLPVIGKVADALTKFLADPAVVQGIKDLGQSIAGLFNDQNLAAASDAIKGFFGAAAKFAPILEKSAQATFTVVKAAVDLFKTLPEPIQQLAVGAFAINKLTGGLVTNLAGGLFDILQKTRGASPANPVFVSDITKGIGGVPGVPATAKGIGTAGKIFLAAESIAAIGAVIATQQEQSSQNQAIATGVSDAIKKQIADGATIADLHKSLDAVNQGIAELQSNPLTVLVRGDALDQLIEQNKNLRAAIAQREKGLVTPLLDRGGRETGNAGTTIGSALARVVQSFVTTVRQGFGNMIKALREAKSDKAIAAAVHEAVNRVTKLNQGSVNATKQTAAGLKAALTRTHDPKLQAEIKAALAKVQAKIPGREYAQRQIAKADKLISDGKITNADLVKIHAIERDLKNKGLPQAATVIATKVGTKSDQIITAQNRTTAAIEAEKAVLIIQNAVSVSLRNLFAAQQTQSSFTHAKAT